MQVGQPAGPPGPAGRTVAAGAAAALAGLLLAGLSPEQLSRLADLRVRVRRGAYAADGGVGAGAPGREPAG